MNRLGSILWLCLVCFCLWSDDVGVSASTVEEPDLDLLSLTNEELEQICTIRGFELTKEVDNETGKSVEYSHDDYVEAARQCLDIEAEMEKIIQENPDILKEIEEESEEMLKEQERLIQQKKELEDKLNKAKTATPEKVPTPKSNDDSTQNIPSQPNNLKQNDDDDDSIIDLDESMDDEKSEKVEKDTTANIKNIESSVNDKKDGNREKTASSSTLKEDLTHEEGESPSPSENNVKDSPMSSLPSPSPTFEKTIQRVKESDQPLFTLKDIAMDFKEQVGKDLDRIGKILLPPSIRGPLVEDVLKPAMRVGKQISIQTYEFLKRYLSVFFAKVKAKVEDELEKRKEQKQLEEQDDTTTPVQDMKLQ
eukprot:CAMPEP_0197833316 /NCGR_PEP_ID=MMETSP1437-20131217/18624_1 /TAXON_ID=49252 ORGANISM="Eucampia antarctica, Strain CCMP1452" /NCGR_SAMPLE_ID=MMETSP1437 /ASSEMBLY_ACC=CAM_ASM_001096 /LENGTH=364 /DNA_ID=CAMNT_0043437295 /DNA_START=116 /DNA_END=1210 /DNA_ORIENTATION=+